MALMFKSYRDESRKNYGIKVNEDTSASYDLLNTGALLRIADAIETLAKSRELLEKERDKYKRWYAEECEKSAHLHARIAGLKGYITRLKKRNSALQFRITGPPI